MALFRAIEREHLIIRRGEATACLHYKLNHAATLTACSGIELLMEYLAKQLHDGLASASRRKANALLNEVRTEERRNNAKTVYWGLGSWADFFKRRGIFDLLCKQFDFTLATLNDYTLSQANETWNKCKHDPYLATPETALATVELFSAYLNETGITADKSHRQQLTIGQLSTHWLGKWDAPLASWLRSNVDAPQSTVLMYLTPLLDLIIQLIDDKRVRYEHKTPLLVAANYVFSSIDLMPEQNLGGEISGLVDDGAVLALTLFWLMQQGDFDKAILFRHWAGGDSIVGEIQELKRHIWTQQSALFPDSRNQMGHDLVWKVIERIAIDGPEALWQNYWKEQYSHGTARPLS